ILGLSWCNKPGCARQVADLIHQLERSVLGVLPKGDDPINGALLDRSIGRGRRTWSAISNKSTRSGPGARIEEEVSLEVVRAIVHTEQTGFGRLPLEPADAAPGMHQRYRAGRT